MTSSLLFNITTFAYLISMLAFFAFLASRTKIVGTVAMPHMAVYSPSRQQSPCAGRNHTIWG